jgi:hypothetical protein
MRDGGEERGKRFLQRRFRENLIRDRARQERLALIRHMKPVAVGYGQAFIDPRTASDRNDG